MAFNKGASAQDEKPPAFNSDILAMFAETGPAIPYPIWAVEEPQGVSASNRDVLMAENTSSAVFGDYRDSAAQVDFDSSSDDNLVEESLDVIFLHPDVFFEGAPYNDLVDRKKIIEKYFDEIAKSFVEVSAHKVLGKYILRIESIEIDEVTVKIINPKTGTTFPDKQLKKLKSFEREIIQNALDQSFKLKVFSLQNEKNKSEVSSGIDILGALGLDDIEESLAALAVSASVQAPQPPLDTASPIFNILTAPVAAPDTPAEAPAGVAESKSSGTEPLADVPFEFLDGHDL